MLPFKPFQGREHQPFHLQGGQAAALLVHGFPGTPLEMRATAEALHELDFTAKGILLPGFGTEIETLPAKTVRDWLDAVTTALAELRRAHDPLVLVGNSMGAALSLAAAAQIRVDALILYAPFWKLTHPLWAALPLLRRILPRVKPMRIMKPDFNNPQFREGLAIKETQSLHRHRASAYSAAAGRTYPIEQRSNWPWPIVFTQPEKGKRR
ncbi:MAG: alpha/beta fold hydrolase [Anaerolineales bacterium]